MNLIDTLSIALRNLWRRKLRTFLTVLGVVIGATSIIIMISLGLAIEKNQMDMVESMGDLRTITIYDSQYMGFSEVESNQKAPPLNDATIKLLKEKSHVDQVYGIQQTYVSGVIKLDKYHLYADIKAVEPDYFEDFEKPLLEGRYLSSSDRFAFIIPEYMKYSLWDEKTNRSAMEDPGFDFLTANFQINIGWDDQFSGTSSKKIKAEMVGVLDTQDWSIYTTPETLKRLVEEERKIYPQDDTNQEKNKSQYDTLEIRVDSYENVKALQDQLKDEGYQAQSMVDFSESMKESQLLIQAVLGGLGSISFIVAAIGIANTMVMSIYERTREIGVMKVIGASVTSIRNIFLIEALLIGLSGGLIGVILSLIISRGLNHFINISYAMDTKAQISVIPLYLVFAGLIFSALVGLISGYYPAKRATKLSAIEAIKTD